MRVIGQAHWEDRRLGYMTETSELAILFSGGDRFQQYVRGDMESDKAGGVELMMASRDKVDGGVRG